MLSLRKTNSSKDLQSFMRFMWIFYVIQTKSIRYSQENKMAILGILCDKYCIFIVC